MIQVRSVNSNFITTSRKSDSPASVFYLLLWPQHKLSEKQGLIHHIFIPLLSPTALSVIHTGCMWDISLQGEVVRFPKGNSGASGRGLDLHESRVGAGGMMHLQEFKQQWREILHECVKYQNNQIIFFTLNNRFKNPLFIRQFYSQRRLRQIWYHSPLKYALTCRWRSKENPDNVRCDDFPLHCCCCLVCSWAEAMWQQIQASRRWRANAHTTMHRSTHTRTITPAFMCMLMKLSMLHWHILVTKYTLFPLMYVQAKSFMKTSVRWKVTAPQTGIQDCTLPLLISCLSLSKGQWCVKLRRAACDSINEWIAFSTVCTHMHLCVRLESIEISTSFDPFLQITHCCGWFSFVCVSVCERGSAEQIGGVSKSLHSTASYC